MWTPSSAFGYRLLNVRLALCLFASIAFFASCSDELTSPSTDAGVSPDALPVDTGVDAGFPDAGPPPDVGVRFASVSCAPCETGCDPSQCLRSNSGESFCADRCDEDLDGCIDGYSCVDITGGGVNPSFFCIPPNATCTAEGSGFGTRCFGSTATCDQTTAFCEGDVVSAGYCTDGCVINEDCPEGFTCIIGDEGSFVCKPTFVAPIETCARGYDFAEIPCAVDTDCANLPGAVCVRSAPELPGVCATGCQDNTDCSGETSCALTARGSVCLSDRCACHAVPDPTAGRDLLGDALDAVGLSRCSAIFSVYDWASEPKDILFDPYRLSFFDPVHNQPLTAPAFGEALVSDIETDAENASLSIPARAARLVERLAELADQPATGETPGMLDPVEPLVSAMTALVQEANGTPDVAAVRADAADVPMALQLAVAEIIDALRRAVIARRAAVGYQTPATNELYAFGPAFVAPRADGRGLAPAEPEVRQLLNRDFGYGRMYGAAVDILDAIDRADLGRFAQAATTETAAEAPLLFNQPTPIGRVVIGGAESHLYQPDLAGHSGAWALLVDLGGNELYRVPASGNIEADNLASVLIDLDGTDQYAYVEVADPNDGVRLPSDGAGRYAPRGDPSEDNGPISLSQTPRQGGGRLGTGILIDFGGDNDRYRSLRMSQGAGLFGTGVLIDDGGDEVYEAEAVAQGAGAFGIGLMLDLGGTDERRAYQMAQGFAYARAVGLSYDADGNDIYFLDPGDPDAGGDPLYFSAQRPGRANSTLGQGFAFGRRADFTDRAFMSGGIGLLVDQRGNDTYTGSIFAQGGGFWFGTGILADRDGGDRYDALWYAMATGAHYGLGLLLEGGGNDTYGGTLPRVNVTMAGAHDYTTAFLIDASGDDVYRGSRISLGAGNVNGFGVFVDRAGNDQYDVRTNYALGSAGLLEAGPSNPGSARRKVDSVGIFIDAAGQDQYSLGGEVVMPYADDASWLQTNNMDPAVAETELGVGIDSNGIVVFE